LVARDDEGFASYLSLVSPLFSIELIQEINVTIPCNWGWHEHDTKKFATFAIKLIKGNHNMVDLKIRPYKCNSIASMHTVIYLHEIKTCKFSHSNNDDQERLKRQTYSLTQTQTNHIQVHRCANLNIDRGGPKHNKIIYIYIYIAISPLSSTAICTSHTVWRFHPLPIFMISIIYHTIIIVW